MNRRPTLLERQVSFVQTFNAIREGIGPVPGGLVHPDIVAAMITASAMLVVGADLREGLVVDTQTHNDHTPDEDLIREWGF